METINYSSCPVCFSNEIQFALAAVDYTVSKESFEIWQCNSCTARFTQNIPAAAEIGRYYKSDQYISHSDTKKGVVNNLYHRVRKITLKQKRKLVENISGGKSGKLLDVGAGTGFFANEMKQNGWSVTALEPDEAARETARKNGIILGDLSELFSLSEGSFDVITLWHVLEHVHDLHSYIDQFKKLLAPRGNLIIAVPNYTSADAKHYKQFWAAYDVPRHLYHFSPKAMQKLMEDHGFVIRKTFPQWFDSFYVSMLSEQYKNGKPGILKGAWFGMMSNLKAIGDKNCSSLIYQSTLIS